MIRPLKRRRAVMLLPLAGIAAASMTGCTGEPGPAPAPSPVTCPTSADQTEFILATAETLIGSETLVCGVREDVPTSLEFTTDWAELFAVDGVDLPAHPELVDGQGEWTCVLASGTSYVLVDDEWYAARPVECSQAL